MPPATVISAVVRLPNVSGLPEDVVENVFNFGAPAVPLAADLQLLMDEVRDFYIANAAGAGTAPALYLSPSISRIADACVVNLYQSADLTGATDFGAPIATDTFTLPAANNTNGLPSEVAVCLSYRGDLTGVPVTENNPAPPPAIIRPQQRRRGRLFFGPLSANAAITTLGQTRPHSSMISHLATNFAGLAGGVGSIVAGLYLGVWSRADADVYEYEAGYVDNAFDTQRRRGVAASGRTLMP